jgi:hypothetical protein
VKQPQPTAIDDQTLVIVERRADRVRALRVRRGNRPVVEEAREFDGLSPLFAWVESIRCGDVRMLLPAAATIVRQTTLPAAVPSQMQAALRLQAEGMFLGSVPSNRLGLGVLAGGDESERQGLIIAWPVPTSGEGDAGLSAKQEKLVRYLPEMAAMIVLATGELPSVSADRAAGSIAISMQGRRGLVLRAARESSSDDGDSAANDAAWSMGVRSAIAETVLNAGVDAGRMQDTISRIEATRRTSGSCTTMLEPSVRTALANALEVKVSSAESDANWWIDWAILLAGAVVANGPLAELAQLRRIEEGEKTSRLEVLVRRYSDPARALRVCVAGFAIVALAPIAFAWMRSAVIQWKMPEEAAVFERNQRTVEQRISHYRELGKRTLPVTKILGDLACCTPDGIEIEQIQLSGTQGVSVRGVSKAKSDIFAENLVTEMASNMDASGVFEKARPRFDAGDGRGILKFDIEAPIVRPTLESAFPEIRDWAKSTLAQRKYGKPGDGGDDAQSGAAAAGAPSSGTAVASAKDPEETDEADDEDSEASGGDGDAGETAVASGSNADRRGSGSGAASVGGPARGISRRGNDAAAGGGSSGSGGSGGAAGSPASGAGSTPAASGSGAGSGGGPAAAALANAQVPNSFTDEELRAMTRDQARGLLAEFSRAKRRADLDAETRKRIDTDFNRILDYLKSIT